jgi:predicted amidohydrolase YtcJ
VTVGDLVLTLGCLAEAGADPRDRIEHASVIPPDLIDWIAELGPTVVTQPHFIAERGDSYLAEVEPSERPWLYRAGALLAAGVRVAGGSDAPYGGANPWRSMQAAVDRRTASGVVIGEAERLSPEAALALYTGALETPGAGPARLAPGEAADLCLIDRGWASARLGLGEVEVRLTLKAGRPIWTSPSLAAG